MLRVYRDEDVSLEPLKDRLIAVIGYGSQGRAQALNFRDSGLKVVVGVRPEGGSWKLASSDGFDVYPISEACRRADVIHILIPDMVQPQVYVEYIEGCLEPGKTLGFAHGFNIHFKQIVPPDYVDVVMVAPKAPGPKVRELYVKGFGVPALVAVYQDYTGEAWSKVLAMAKALGCTRAGVIETTFRDETESDLIGEQTVLVGGILELIKNGFEVLVEAGYPEELAYFEACNEAKLIIDLIYEGGFTKMLRSVSDTAKHGGLTVGPKIIDQNVRENMRRAVEYVKSGRYAEEWIREYKAGMPNLRKLLSEIENHPIEIVGRRLRKLSGLEE
ncbi:MAG: ketol-acid reductoisomerase [Nitrososphaerota archaeon]|nr:ketol-acid reductoisomerase [Candidatus Bathyarchaeota archaeon]MDW8061106.1 ketol-acid reductoisomerase [Nitrososphaerota archaeon]